MEVVNRATRIGRKNEVTQPMSEDLDDNEIDALCIELAKQGHRVKGIVTELRRVIGSKRPAQRSVAKEYRTRMRQQRKALAEELAQQRAEQLAQQRAGINAEALTNLQERIAALNEQTREEQHKEHRLVMAELRDRLGSKANGSGA